MGPPSVPAAESSQGLKRTVQAAFEGECNPVVPIRLSVFVNCNMSMPTRGGAKG